MRTEDPTKGHDMERGSPKRKMATPDILTNIESKQIEISKITGENSHSNSYYSTINKLDEEKGKRSSNQKFNINSQKKDSPNNESFKT